MTPPGVGHEGVERKVRDTGGFDQFYRETAPRILRYGYALTGDLAEAMFWRERQSEPGRVPDGEFQQTITLYQPGGAAQFFTELRSALAGCAAEPYLGGLARYAVIAERTFGDDSVAVSVTRYYPTSSAGEPNNGPPPEFTQFITVVRIGDAVTVLFGSGWERFPVDWAVVETMTERAVRRITDWRGP